MKQRNEDGYYLVSLVFFSNKYYFSKFQTKNHALDHSTCRKINHEKSPLKYKFWS